MSLDRGTKHSKYKPKFSVFTCRALTMSVKYLPTSMSTVHYWISTTNRQHWFPSEDLDCDNMQTWLRQNQWCRKITNKSKDTTHSNYTVSFFIFKCVLHEDPSLMREWSRIYWYYSGRFWSFYWSDPLRISCVPVPGCAEPQVPGDVFINFPLVNSFSSESQGK